MRNQNLGIPIKHQSDGVSKEVGDRAVFTVHFLWWLSSQNQKLNEDTKIKCGVLLMWYTVHHLECTSNSLGATSLWPAGLPKARKIQTYLIYIVIFSWSFANFWRDSQPPNLPLTKSPLDDRRGTGGRCSGSNFLLQTHLIEASSSGFIRFQHIGLIWFKDMVFVLWVEPVLQELLATMKRCSSYGIRIG